MENGPHIPASTEKPVSEKPIMSGGSANAHSYFRIVKATRLRTETRGHETRQNHREAQCKAGTDRKKIDTHTQPVPTRTHYIYTHQERLND